MRKGEFKVGQAVQWLSPSSQIRYEGHVAQVSAPAIVVRDPLGRCLSFTYRLNDTYILRGMRDPRNQRGRCALRIAPY